MKSLILCIAIFSSSLADLLLPRLERKAVYPFNSARVDPAAMGLPELDEVIFTSSEHQLILWVAAPAPNQPTILYFHGNAGNLANRATRFRLLTERGYGLIAPAYRGSSGSSGRPSEAAITRDMRRIYAALDDLIPGLTPADTVIYGESLGSAVALKLLDAPEMPAPAGVVLESPFTALADVVRHVYPELEELIPKMQNRWLSQEHAPTLTAPLLVLHGEADTLIPIEQGRAVFNAAGSARKRFVTIPEADHSETWRSDVLPKLWRFVDGI